MTKEQFAAVVTLQMLSLADNEDEAIDLLAAAFGVVHQRGKYDAFKLVSDSANGRIVEMEDEAQASLRTTGKDDPDFVALAILYGKVEAYKAIAEATAEVAGAIEASVIAKGAADVGIEDAFEEQPRINAQVEGFKYADLNLVNIGPEAAR